MDEQDVPHTAQRMIDIFGDEAENVAVSNARTFAGHDQVEESLFWENVATAICELQQKS